MKFLKSSSLCFWYLRKGNERFHLLPEDETFAEKLELHQCQDNLDIDIKNV